MPRGKLLLLTIPLLISGIFVVASPAPAPAATQIGSGAWAGVSTGGSHTCAISTGRSLYCWGDNSSGQIGDGTTTARPSPKRIASAGIWSTAAAGGSHTCAITTGRSLYCWGDNSDGQIGDGTTTKRRYPKRIASAGIWSTASTGDEHTCAITTGRSLYCWGDNSDGQIGDGTLTQRRSPKKIGGSGVWTTVSTGELHTCAISTAKTLYCWGDNTHGQTNTSTATRYSYPKRLFSYADVRRIDAGTRTSCAIRGTGTLICWGNRVTTTPTPTPTPPPSPSPTPKAPGEILNLSYWKLTTPVNTSAVSGDPDEIKFGRTPDLATHFDSDYFFPNTTPAAGIAAYEGVYFRARTDGATTDNSNYPRSELREMKSDGVTNAGWSNASGTHRMTITQAITHVPDVKPHVVAGQIHGGSGESDILQIRLEGNELFATFEGDSDFDQTLNANYQLGTMFTVEIQADARGITVNYEDTKGVNEQVSHYVVASAPTWYFKAGVYTQAYAGQSFNDKIVKADSYGEVLIDSLSISPVT